MGSNSLTPENDGNTADASDVNQYRDALIEDHVPRNSSGVPTDEAGSLGTSLLKWLNAYIKRIFVGNPDSGVTLEEDSGELVVKVDSIEAMRVDSEGIKPGSFPAMGVLPQLKSTTFTSSGTFTVPADVTLLFVFGAGGGGGGGSGSGRGSIETSGGGGGGNGAQPVLVPIPVTPSSSINVVVGAGGVGGAPVNSGNGNPGISGGDTNFGGYIFKGADGGAPGIQQNTSALTPSTWGPRVHNIGGGQGGSPGSGGQNGERSFYANAGLGGSSATSAAGGGGGGGSGAGDGGNGGRGTTPAVAGNDGSFSAGGGGGGGVGIRPNNSGRGGNGGNGFVRVYYISHL